MPKKLIVGLGNPGTKYLRTRHNLGFWVLDCLAEKLEAPWRGVRNKSAIAHAVYSSWNLLLAKPVTYMNLSGESVNQLLQKERLTSKEMLVICDDVNLPLGKLRLRAQGSAGGHHGLESIIASIGSDDFPRLRIGVKTESMPPDLADFVLNRFPKGEEAIVSESVRRAIDAILVLLDENIEKAMNFANGISER